MPPSTGRSRTPATQLGTQFGTPRTEGHEGLLLTMRSIDPDIKDIAWADRMLMQLYPTSDDEAVGRASYSEEMMTDLLERARVLLEVRVAEHTQLPSLPSALNLPISPTAPYYQPALPAPLREEDASMPPAGELSTQSTGGEAVRTTILSSDIEKFGANQPIMAGKSIPVPEDSMDHAIRIPALPAVDFTQELRDCFSITDDRDYTATQISTLYSPMEDDSVLRIDHRVAHAAALEEYSTTAERQAANSPYIRHMGINDIVNVVAESLASKGLDSWT